MKLPVEDGFSDVLSKAQKGLGISTEELSVRSGVSEETLRALRRGDYEENAVRAAADALGLNVPAVVRLGEGSWRPQEVAGFDGMELIATPFYEWHVNAFLVWIPETGEAIAFDTGTKAKPLVEFAKSKELDLKAIFLTHAHGDHIAGLVGLLQEWEAEVYVGEKEPGAPATARKIDGSFQYNLGRLTLRCLDTPGHTAGGMSFILEGLARKVAIVGDALFAGSMGGANVSYAEGLDSLSKLLDLPGETVLAPGHGPLTTVAEERQMNCFSGAKRSI